MENVVNSAQWSQTPTSRNVIHRTRGFAHGPIVRLMSPSDLGEELKPFVFLDRFEADMRALAGGMPVHPHSGIATITVFTEGDVTFDDPQAGHGTLGYGGVEWVRAGRGMWHGKELAAGTSKTVQGFQLWIALPPDLENAEPEAQYIGAQAIPTIGPARLIVGAYGGATSPVRAPDAINYLLVTLKPGERWTYEPPPDHVVRWVALAKGALLVGERLSDGELVTFEKNAAPITFEGAAGVGATFALGSAVPHPHQLHLGAYSVHTSEEALAAGERNIRQLKQRLDAAGDRGTGSGSTPVFRE
jgi:redox-sensitive bicupin YhaK (pirin superfamily)